MEKKEKERIVLLGVVGIIVVIALAVVAGWQLGVRSGMEEQASPEEPGMTREEVPLDTVVPNSSDDTIAPENVARPEVVKPSAPGVTSSDREFEIELRDGAFVPDTIAVYQGDVIRIRFTAVDGAYDVFQPDRGLSITLKRGETKLMASQFAESGKYTLYCQSCGGPEEGPVGYILVVPKE